MIGLPNAPRKSCKRDYSFDPFAPTNSENCSFVDFFLKTVFTIFLNTASKSFETKTVDKNVRVKMMPMEVRKSIGSKYAKGSIATSNKLAATFILILMFTLLFMSRNLIKNIIISATMVEIEAAYNPIYFTREKQIIKLAIPPASVDNPKLKFFFLIL